MNDDDLPRMDEADAAEALASLFPGDTWLADVATELRADGWSSAADEHTLAAQLGTGLWDIFSDNHDVIAADGRAVHLGSWRGSGSTISEFLNPRVALARFDYMDFYMGSQLGDDREAYAPIHRLIFRRLRARGYDWRYAFPEIFAVRFPRPEPVGDPSHPDWKGYSPADELARETEERQRAAADAEFDDQLARAHREDLERARTEPPPTVVEAYRTVYGHDPPGWPPWEEAP